MSDQTIEILRLMHNAYHVGGGDCFDDIYCLFERNLRPFAERLARAESEPQGIALVKQLRDALGLDNGARPESPQAVWEETLVEVRKLLAELERIRPDRDCMVSDRDAHCERADLAEIEVKRLLGELYRFGVGVRYHERIEERTHPLLSKRIERLEQATAEIAKRGVNASLAGALGEIVREVAGR